MPRLAEFIAAGHHGTMDWLAAEAGRRGDPHALWSAVKSVVMVGLNYGPSGDPLASLAEKDRATLPAGSGP